MKNISNDSAFQLGNFKFKSVSSDVEVLFQDQIREAEEEEELHTKQALEAEYSRGVEETRAVYEKKIQELEAKLTADQTEYNEKLTALKEGMSRSLEELEIQMFDEICDMSFRLTEMILKREILNKEDIESLIRKSLKEIDSRAKVTVRLNSEDFPGLSEKLSSTRIVCETDESLEKGECYIDHAQGYLDLRVESRLSELQDEFYNLKNSGADNAE